MLTPREIAEHTPAPRAQTDHVRWPTAYVCLEGDETRSRVSRLLQEAGYAVVAFTDGVSFLAEVADAPPSSRMQWEPDLIVADAGDSHHAPMELLQGTEDLGYKAPILMFARRDHELRRRPLFHSSSSVVFVDPGDVSDLLAFAALIRFQRSKSV